MMSSRLNAPKRLCDDQEGQVDLVLQEVRDLLRGRMPGSGTGANRASQCKESQMQHMGAEEAMETKGNQMKYDNFESLLVRAAHL